MSSPVKNEDASSMWSYAKQFIVPPISASLAILPVFYGLAAKSKLQQGEPLPKMSLKEVVMGGCKISPTIGFIVGTQMVVQNIVEKALMTLRAKQDTSNIATMFASTIIVGGISAPALAVFNGQTMGHSIMRSLKSLSVKQTAAIVSRETSFLFALRVSDPVSKAMKETIGDNKVVEYSCCFTSGAIGSIVGHPADTMLTLWQNQMKVISCRQLMRGASIKAVALGGFSVFYKMAKETFNDDCDE